MVAKLSRVNLTKSPLNLEKFSTKYSIGEINLKKELNKKEIDKLNKYIENLENKLNNKNFIKNAPKKIIDDIKNKLKVTKSKL